MGTCYYCTPPFCVWPLVVWERKAFLASASLPRGGVCSPVYHIPGWPQQDANSSSIIISCFISYWTTTPSRILPVCHVVVCECDRQSQFCSAQVTGRWLVHRFLLAWKGGCRKCVFFLLLYVCDNFLWISLFSEEHSFICSFFFFFLFTGNCQEGLLKRSALTKCTCKPHWVTIALSAIFWSPGPLIPTLPQWQSFCCLLKIHQKG